MYRNSAVIDSAVEWVPAADILRSTDSGTGDLEPKSINEFPPIALEPINSSRDSITQEGEISSTSTARAANSTFPYVPPPPPLPPPLPSTSAPLTPPSTRQPPEDGPLTVLASIQEIGSERTHSNIGIDRPQERPLVPLRHASQVQSTAQNTFNPGPQPFRPPTAPTIPNNHSGAPQIPYANTPFIPPSVAHGPPPPQDYYAKIPPTRRPQSSSQTAPSPFQSATEKTNNTQPQHYPIVSSQQYRPSTTGPPQQYRPSTVGPIQSARAQSQTTYLSSPYPVQSARAQSQTTYPSSHYPVQSARAQSQTTYPSSPYPVSSGPPQSYTGPMRPFTTGPSQSYATSPQPFSSGPPPVPTRPSTTGPSQFYPGQAFSSGPPQSSSAPRRPFTDGPSLSGPQHHAATRPPTTGPPQSYAASPQYFSTSDPSPQTQVYGSSDQQTFPLEYQPVVAPPRNPARKKTDAYVANDPFRLSHSHGKADKPADGLTFDDIPVPGAISVSKPWAKYDESSYNKPSHSTSQSNTFPPTSQQPYKDPYSRPMGGSQTAPPQSHPGHGRASSPYGDAYNRPSQGGSHAGRRRPQSARYEDYFSPDGDPYGGPIVGGPIIGGSHPQSAPPSQRPSGTSGGVVDPLIHKKPFEFNYPSDFPSTLPESSTGPSNQTRPSQPDIIYVEPTPQVPQVPQYSNHSPQYSEYSPPPSPQTQLPESGAPQPAPHTDPPSPAGSLHSLPRPSSHDEYSEPPSSGQHCPKLASISLSPPVIVYNPQPHRYDEKRDSLLSRIGSFLLMPFMRKPRIGDVMVDPPTVITSGPPSITTDDSGKREAATIVLGLFFSTIPKHVYLHMLLRLPSLYFSRVARIFEEADLTLPEIKKMALETASHGKRDEYDIQMAFEGPAVPPAYERLKTTWESFIDSVMREWKTFNIISVLLLSAILTILQIETAASDPVTRYTALFSLICALISLLFGCMYIIRFGSMRKTYKAAEWALEAKKTKTVIWWNVWVLLAMPAIWLTWSIILYIACIMAFVWRTGGKDTTPSELSDKGLLAMRIIITIVLGLGLLYGCLIVSTFRRYGEVMDKAWKSRIDGWIDEKAAGTQTMQPPLQSNPYYDSGSHYPHAYPTTFDSNYQPPFHDVPSYTDFGLSGARSRGYDGMYSPLQHTGGYNPPPEPYVTPTQSRSGSPESTTSTVNVTRSNTLQNQSSKVQREDSIGASSLSLYDQGYSFQNPVRLPPRKTFAQGTIPPRLVPIRYQASLAVPPPPNLPPIPGTPLGALNDRNSGDNLGLLRSSLGAPNEDEDDHHVRFRSPLMSARGSTSQSGSDEDVEEPLLPRGETSSLSMRAGSATSPETPENGQDESLRRRR
ncbi:hypothetical protein B0H34DRAFT_674211 [Crassisporium funariophilum]|nr:hypothetical protein B0H34DRAFT_674211 [Crassisporium funariophilum]